MNHAPNAILAARLRSIRFALAGIGALVATQPNARIHAAATIAVIAAGIAVRLHRDEWLWIVLAVCAVWTAEAFNTAVECVVDLVSPEHHPLAGMAKDVAAAAVLISAAGAVIIGVLVFGPHVPAAF